MSAVSRSGLVKGVKVDVPLSWKDRSTVAYRVLYVVLAALPTLVITSVTSNMCFSSFVRVDKHGEVLSFTFDKYMVGGCPEPHVDPSALYPNATAGFRAWAEG